MEVLRRSRIRDLRKLTVERIGNDLALHGVASSFYHKQLAQELVRKELDGEEIVNHVQVIHPLPHAAQR
jgi:hypothetical protein